MENINVMFSSQKDEWETPQELFDELNSEFRFVLDPCATDENSKCNCYFTKNQDGLSKKWFGSVFMNPPYGRDIYKWVKKAWEESLSGVTVVCLLPARTDTKWWHEFCMNGEIRFIKGRLKFGNHQNSAPFPSAIVIFRGKKL